MEKDKYIDDLREIRNTMSLASRFISLSGFSGVSTGIIALLGALFSYEIVFKNNNYLVFGFVEISSKELLYLLLIAFATLLLSIGSALFFTNRKTKKNRQEVWNAQTKRLLINLCIPLVTGGLLCLTFLFKGFVSFLAPLTLIFYGLSLINGSKYTLSEIRALGVIELLLGLLAFQFIAYSLLFWALGFGVVQIIYGLIIQKKY